MVKFCHFSTFFSTNWHRTREPEELQRTAKAHSIALLKFFCYYNLRFDLRSTVWAPESKSYKIAFFFSKKTFHNNFWLSEETTLILPVSYFSSWDASNELYFDLKRSFWKFDLRSSHDSWPDRKRSCCISVDPYGRPEHIYGIFMARTGLYPKLLPR